MVRRDGGEEWLGDRDEGVEGNVSPSSNRYRKGRVLSPVSSDNRKGQDGKGKPENAFAMVQSSSHSPIRTCPLSTIYRLCA